MWLELVFYEQVTMLPITLVTSYTLKAFQFYFSWWCC